MKVLALILVSCLAVAITASPFGYRCEGAVEPAKCIRELKSQTADLMSLEACKLTCGMYGALFPRPKTVTLGSQVVSFVPSQVKLAVLSCETKVCPLANAAFVLFEEALLTSHPESEAITWGTLDHSVTISITITSPDDSLTLQTDESYSLDVTTQAKATAVVIAAPTFFGARHALETLTQLIDYDASTNGLQIVQSVSIRDAPAFPYRGIIVDTARNFLTVGALKRSLRAMAHSKLNTFHWHITDSQSFPLVLPSQANFSLYGAYSPREVYTTADVKDIVQYAKVRGIRVLPEFDAPAHAAHGWEWGPGAGLGNLAVCIDQQPWDKYCAGPPCGQLNIANPKIYDMLSLIYKDILDMFGPIDLFHYGGDEIYVSCWNSTKEIRDWMTLNGNGLDTDSYYKQWSIFQEKARQLLVQANNNQEVPGIIWTSHLTEAGRASQYLNQSQYIVQIWTTGKDPLIGELLTAGYQIIFSNYDALYFDCGFSSWVNKGVNWCSPYKGWQDAYDNDILGISNTLTGSKFNAAQVLGGEAAAWSEQIDEHTLDAKLWPRSSALGERLWSNPKETYHEAEPRILEHRKRLTQRGVRAERLQPEWCRQNSGECRVPTA